MAWCNSSGLPDVVAFSSPLPSSQPTSITGRRDDSSLCSGSDFSDDDIFVSKIYASRDCLIPELRVRCSGAQEAYKLGCIWRQDGNTPTPIWCP